MALELRELAIELQQQDHEVVADFAFGQRGGGRRGGVDP